MVLWAPGPDNHNVNSSSFKARNSPLGCLHKSKVFFMSVFTTRALLFGVYIQTPRLLKSHLELPFNPSSLPQTLLAHPQQCKLVHQRFTTLNPKKLALTAPGASKNHGPQTLHFGAEGFFWGTSEVRSTPAIHHLAILHGVPEAFNY